MWLYLVAPPTSSSLLSFLSLSLFLHLLPSLNPFSLSPYSLLPLLTLSLSPYSLLPLLTPSLSPYSLLSPSLPIPYSLPLSLLPTPSPYSLPLSLLPTPSPYSLPLSLLRLSLLPPSLSLLPPLSTPSSLPLSLLPPHSLSLSHPHFFSIPPLFTSVCLSVSLSCLSVGWRPAFKLYSAWVALFGSAICVAIMFVINWYFALITLIIVAFLYKVVDFLKPGQTQYICLSV